ncbi:hypothetical protein Bca4012_091020 [Brassica carinata]|uniref:B3 domain-containing protein At3g11580 isoform X1 n=1 Tax=Brassica oleracea var. oleracea TaxID=109376 RepID=UPI0006A70E26|nr:PREDICTED: B3 domain-containing protein At3g11580 isoform X1 [Brassica oleracea var. oleracea]
MSGNHYSRDIHHNTPSLHHHQNDAVVDREYLFEKSLTPSDVGKLNRLVIPKQHAEKHFPLNNAADDVAAAETTEKGMLLTFEDESGKCWKFRYSYWNSSQSYVLTKGWSRYVKDKQLHAGDVVFFQRHRFDLHRVFIGWRKRGEVSSPSAISVVSQDARVNTTAYWSNGLTTPYRQVHASTSSYPNIHQEYSHYDARVSRRWKIVGAVAETPTVVTGSSRTVRLFGVNLECHGDVVEPPPCPDGYNGQHFYYYSTPHPMNISFAGEAMEQVGDRRG